LIFAAINPQNGDRIVTIDSVTSLHSMYNRLTATDHISYMLTASSSLLYALRVLRGHGLPELSAKDVFHTVFSETTYCLPAWFGYCILLQPIAIASTRSCVAVSSKASGLPVTCHPYAPLLRTSRTLCSIKFFVVTIISYNLTCQIDRKYFIISENASTIRL